MAEATPGGPTERPAQERPAPERPPRAARAGVIPEQFDPRRTPPPVTVVVALGPGDGGPRAEACLDAVRMSLRRNDDVIVVDATGDPTALSPWAYAPARVIETDPAGRDGAVEQAVGQATGDVVVLVDRPWTPPPSWLEPLRGRTDLPRPLVIDAWPPADPADAVGLDPGAPAPALPNEAEPPDRVLVDAARVAAQHPDDDARFEASRRLAAALSQIGKVRLALDWIGWARDRAGDDLAELVSLAARVNVGDVEALEPLVAALPAEQVERLRSAIATALADLPADTKVRRSDLVYPSAWPTLAELAVSAEPAPVALDAPIEAIPDDELRVVFARLQFASPEAADAVAEAAWAQRPGNLTVLAFAAEIGPRLRVERALEWSARLRAGSMGDRCPLVEIAGDATRPGLERLRAATAAAESFEDARAVALFDEAARAVAPKDLPQALVEVHLIAPDRLDALVLAAATDLPRCLVLASALHAYGATDGALSVLLHGLSLPGATRTAVATALVELVQPDDAAALAAAAFTSGEPKLTPFALAVQEAYPVERAPDPATASTAAGPAPSPGDQP